MLCWDVERDGHLAVVGAASSGRSTLLRALVGSAGQAARVGAVHVLTATDPSTGPLADVAGLPWVGTVVEAADVDRVSRLTALLREDAVVGSTMLVGSTVLVVDGWESVEELWGRLDHGRMVEDLLRLVRDAAPAGLRVAVSGGRALLGGTLGSLLTARVLLGAADPTLPLLMGVPAAAACTAAVPGRLLHRERSGDWVEAQTLLDRGEDLPRPSSGAGGEAVAGRVAVAPRLLALPRRVAADGLPATALGLGDDDVRPVQVREVDVPGVLVTGADGAGRSTALARWAAALVAAGQSVILVPDDDGPCARLAAVDGLQLFTDTPGRSAPVDPLAVRLRRALNDPRLTGAALLLDDGWARRDGVEDVALAHLAGSGDQHARARVVATSTPSEAAVAFRGLVPALRRWRTGLVLGARGPNDGECVGTRLPACPAGPPGRGVLVVRGRVRQIQTAEPLGWTRNTERG